MNDSFLEKIKEIEALCREYIDLDLQLKNPELPNPIRLLHWIRQVEIFDNLREGF